MKKFTLLVLTLMIVAIASAQVEGVWKIYEGDGGLWVGPDAPYGATTWWQTNPDVVGERACYFDDRYVFKSDNTFENVLGEETWLEQWQSGEANAICGAPVAPHDGSADATWEISGNELIITGKGAYIGLPKVINDGEIDDPANAPEEIFYTIVSNEDDKLILAIEFQDNGYWAFTLVKDDETTSLSRLSANNSFSVYPTTANSEINLQSEQVINTVNVYNTVGQLVISKAVSSMSTQLDINKLSNGVYIVRAELSDGSVASQRFIKKQ